MPAEWSIKIPHQRGHVETFEIWKRVYAGKLKFFENEIFSTQCINQYK